MVETRADLSELTLLGDDIEYLRTAFEQGTQWNDVIPFISMEVDKVFTTEGYGRWEKLSDTYFVWKAQNYPDQDILRLTDRYYSAATQRGLSLIHI